MTNQWRFCAHRGLAHSARLLIAGSVIDLIRVAKPDRTPFSGLAE